MAKVVVPVAVTIVADVSDWPANLAMSVVGSSLVSRAAARSNDATAVEMVRYLRAGRVDEEGKVEVRDGDREGWVGHMHTAGRLEEEGGNDGDDVIVVDGSKGCSCPEDIVAVVVLDAVGVIDDASAECVVIVAACCGTD